MSKLINIFDLSRLSAGGGTFASAAVSPSSGLGAGATPIIFNQENYVLKSVASIRFFSEKKNMF